MLTFVCDQCGATGTVQAPGSARCTKCGYVALVKTPAGWQPTPDPDPFAPRPDARASAARDGVERNTAPKERLATLWVRPGAEQTPTAPHALSAAPPPRRRSAASGTAIAAILLAGSAAVALSSAVVVRPRWLDRGGASSGVQSPAPVQQPAPTPPASPEPIPRASAEKVSPVPAKRALTASASPAVRGALVNPVPADRRCVPRALRARSDLSGRLPPELAVRFRVTASGDVARIEVLDVADRDVADAVGEAVRSCRFSPGTDENGRPIALPITMRIRFAAPPEATSGF